MPKVYITEEDRLNEALLNEIGAQAGRKHMTCPQISEKTGISQSTLYHRLKKPDTLRLFELRLLARVLQLSDEQILTAVRGKR